MVEALLHPVELLLLEMRLRLLKKRKRRRKKVWQSSPERNHSCYSLLTKSTEKEESDEDMGFGLFD